MLPLESLQAQQYSLLQLLATAHKERLMMGPLVYCFAKEHRRWNRLDLQALGIALNGGMPLSRAIEVAPNALSTDSRIALQAADTPESMDRVFEQLLQTEKFIIDDTQEKWFSQVIYWFCISVPLLMIIAGWLYFILPVMLKMFNEFGLELPPASALVISIIEPMFLLAIPVIGAPFAFLIYQLTPLRLIMRQWSNGLKALIFPSIRNEFVRKQLSISLASEQGLAAIIERLRHIHPFRAVRSVMRRAHQQMEQGNEAWAVLANVGIVNSKQAAALRQMQTDRDRAWALRKLVELRRRKSRRRLYVGLSILHPVLLLFCGILVLAMCSLSVEPFTVIIEAMANQP